MYMDYTKLWKLLIDKGISRTELMELTGISSRVLAKLAKNRTVTTDTIARICEVLSCDCGDIMECKSDEVLSFYAYAQRYGEVVSEDEEIRTLAFERAGKRYTVHMTKRAASRTTEIHCRADGTVYRIQLYPLAGGISSPSRVESVLVKPRHARGETVIVVITGKPNVITGLDEGSFVSAKGGARKESDVYVMSLAAFKLFEP